MSTLSINERFRFVYVCVLARTQESPQYTQSIDIFLPLLLYVTLEVEWLIR
jgi:hypothetical protein